MATKNNIVVVITGNIDAGKSTLVGHFIQLMGGVTEEKMASLEEQSKQKGMESFKYAWILDRLMLERDKGLTIDLTYQNVDLPTHSITFIDSPGHYEFIKNMIIATSNANAALLVVSASPKEFEFGISDQGQTKKHLLLAYTLGVKKIVVAINKMDLVGYSEERFKYIMGIIQGMLIKLKYSEIAIIPVSGWTGDNVIAKSASMSWYYDGKYAGATLLDALNGIKVTPMHKSTKKEVYKIGQLGEVCIREGKNS